MLEKFKSYLDIKILKQQRFIHTSQKMVYKTLDIYWMGFIKMKNKLELNNNSVLLRDNSYFGVIIQQITLTIG